MLFASSLPLQRKDIDLPFEKTIMMRWTESQSSLQLLNISTHCSQTILDRPFHS